MQFWLWWMDEWSEQSSSQTDKLAKAMACMTCLLLWNYIWCKFHGIQFQGILERNQDQKFNLTEKEQNLIKPDINLLCIYLWNKIKTVLVGLKTHFDDKIEMHNITQLFLHNFFKEIMAKHFIPLHTVYTARLDAKLHCYSIGGVLTTFTGSQISNGSLSIGLPLPLEHKCRSIGGPFTANGQEKRHEGRCKMTADAW